MNRYTLTYQKTVNTCYLIGIASIIIIPDVIFGLLLELFHHLFELIHLLFEIFEAMLDHLVEHIFHTGLHATQIIVFYVMISMIFGGLYFLKRPVFRFFHTMKENILAAWLTHKIRTQSYWNESPSNKFKLIALCNVGFICFILFGF